MIERPRLYNRMTKVVRSDDQGQKIKKIHGNEKQQIGKVQNLLSLIKTYQNTFTPNPN